MMLMKSSEGNPDREGSLERYKIVDVSHIEEGGGGEEGREEGSRRGSEL
jgi:hypothetical protein